LARLQRVWRKAGEAARVQWEAAKLHGVVPSPMDGIYFENQQELNAQFPDLVSSPPRPPAPSSGLRAANWLWLYASQRFD
jgi:hypothetical protein